ncbi:MAG: AAA family ATPase, partial [Nanoarchaeota archaeon]|nr:AAA family ATPase [Nanoarchaeota archaeon]
MNELLEDPDLENPDSNTYQAQFSWDEEFQKTIVSFLMSDRTFLLHSIDLIKPTYFTSKAHQKACEVIFNHYKKYRYIPSQIELVEELKKELKGDKYLIHHLAEIKSLYDYFEPNVESRDYLTDKLTFFAKIQSLRQAFSKSLKQIDKNPESEETWSKVYDLLREAMNTDRSFDVGLEYFNTLRERYDKMHEDDDGAEYFKTGYEDFDREIKGGGYIRGEVLGVVGGSGVGKSILMSCIGAHNLKVGKNVLYISLELTEARVAERFDSILTDVPIYSLYESRDNVFERLEEIVAKKENKNMLLIKQFPSASADVNTIRAYMSQLKFYGFRPDVVIIDYIGEMKDIPGLPTHESRERTVKELRGLAGEEQVFMVTAFQPNRGSKELQENNGVIEEEHLADSFGQIRPLDGCLSINQNKNEKSVNIGRMWVIKQRNGKSRYMIYLKFHPQTLQITEIHHDTYRDMNSRKKEEICQSVEDQMLEATVKPIEISKEKIAEMAFKAKNSYQEDG